VKKRFFAFAIVSFAWYFVPAVRGQEPTLSALPGKLSWRNSPSAWHIEAGRELRISAGAKTDWFVDPFNRKVTNTAPILLFEPGRDYVLRAKVSLDFHSKWDAGAFMVWADDHHWAKLSFELSPYKQPTMVTVVTRGVSDDCNSFSITGNSVFLQVARTGNTYVFYSSTDGHDWRVLRTFNLDTNLKQMVGFEAQSPAGGGADVTFLEVHYSPTKIKNIYTGQ
jgi:uncharacterized protein